MGAGGGVGQDIPPRKIFCLRFPPFERGTLWQNIPPLQKCFQQNIQRVPPPDQNFFRNFQKISEFWSRVVQDIPPLRTKNLSPPKIFFQNIPPLRKFSKFSPRRPQVLAHVWSNVYYLEYTVSNLQLLLTSMLHIQISLILPDFMQNS